MLAGAGQQGVQVGGDRDTVLRVGDVIAPALAGPVVGADPGGAGHLRGDRAPQRRDLVEAVLEDDGGAAGAGACQVQSVVADVVQRAGHRVAGVVDGRATVSRAPPRAAIATRPMAGYTIHRSAGRRAVGGAPHPDGEGERGRRPHPAGGGEHVVTGR